MRPHISLEWDDCQKKVLAKREQIGISWRDISPSIDTAHQFKTGLADVFPVPEEIFRLENLMSILWFVWKTHLSESERSHVSQFLPRGTDDVDQVVHALLMGENLHFGNPSFSWGASLCSGNLHPDVLIHRDHRFKARKKAYYLGLQKYHFDMVDNLQKWKSRLARCNNLEGEIVGKMWRKHKLGSSTIASEATEEVANSGQEMLDKPYIHFGDAAKNETYSKTTKKQDQQVTRMTLCHDDTQSKSPNHVTINVQSIHVQPCKEFEEEETKKLHDHRLQLVSRDIPVAFANDSKGQLQKELSMKWLEKELEEEKELLMDEYFAARNVWEEARTSDSYCHLTTTSHGCAYTDELSLRQPQSVKEQQAPLINLESDAIELEAGESLPPHASSNEAMPLLHTDHGTSSFYSYTDQAHCGLLPPFIKDQKMSQYYPQENTNGLKQPGLLFLEENNILPENGQLHQQFEEQQRHLFEQMQIRDRELYMRQLIHENIYSSSSIYGRQELQTTAANVQGWAADSAHAAAPIQSPLGSSRFLNHDWLPGSRGQFLEYNANMEERLFSIFPNELHSLPPYTSMNPEQYGPAKNFISSGGIGSLHQLNYLNTSETPPAAMKVDNNPFMWMNMPNPNPGPRDANGKPSLR